MTQFTAQSPMPCSAAELFAWHERAGAFARLSPPWQRMRMAGGTSAVAAERGTRGYAWSPGGIRDGDVLLIEMKQGPVWVKWKAVHCGYIPGIEFSDEAVSGPFRKWFHTHRCDRCDRSEGNAVSDVAGADSSVLRDTVEYVLPLEPLSRWVAGGKVARDIERVFRFRHARTKSDLMRHAAMRELMGRGGMKGTKAMRIVVTGATGLVGTQLCALLAGGGHEVFRLVRRATGGKNDIVWDPAAGVLDAAALEGMDAVIHLAGENVGAKWTKKRRAAIRESRVTGTTLLANTIASLKRKPRAFICASATGFYGTTRGDETLDEQSTSGTGFLAEVCREWEAACEPAVASGIRVVNARIGVIMAAQGGALSKLVPPFKMGAGGKVGSGKQYMSWIALDDAVGALAWLAANEAVSGPVNLVAPKPVTNLEFTKTLGKVLRRPTIAPLPAFVVNLVFGEMGREMLLGGSRVKPTVLEKKGFEFRFPALEGALRHELGR